MKVWVVIPSLGRGGAERSVSRLSQAWARDHAVTVTVFDGSRGVFSAGGDLTDLAVPAGGGFRGVVRRMVHLRSTLRSLDPTRILAFTETANIPVILTALLCGRRHLVTLSVRGNPDQMPWFYKGAAFFLYGLAARVVVVSQGAATRLGKIAPACRSKLEVIYSPLPLDEIHICVQAPLKDSGGNLVPETIPYFFAAGRLVPGKAFDRMIELFDAATVSLSGDRESRLLIAGEGPERERLQTLIHARGLQERVHLLGAVENPFAFMARARALLMTSEHEGFPVVLIEAFACGCPVIAFDCDFGPREVILDGESGFLVPPRDSVGFTARVEQLLTDDRLRARMSLAAQRRARDFELDAIAARWMMPLEKAS